MQKLTQASALRTPQIIQAADAKHDQVVFENYDDTNYGYLRIVVNARQLRIEYHPASDGAAAKTPDDFVTVDLATRKLVHYTANDLGRPKAAAEAHSRRAAASSATPPKPAGTRKQTSRKGSAGGPQGRGRR